MTEGSRWRVLTWNVHGAAMPDLAALADVISDLAPDAVALQEVRRRQARAIAASLSWHQAWMFKHNAYTWLLWWRAEGLAILSPSPLGDVTRWCISPGVSRRSFRRRVVIAATVQRPGASLRVYDTHLATHSVDERIAQARRIAELMRAELAPAAVVAGDLNARDEVEVIRELRAVGLVDPGGDPTSPSVAPVKRIDYVLVPETATVVERVTPDGGQDWHRLSDHLPTLLEVDLAGEVRSAPSSASAPSPSPPG